MAETQITKTMNAKIDLKSALFGLGVGVLAMLAVGAASSSHQVGRYRIAASAPHCWILDTATGKVWGANCSNVSAGPDGAFLQPKVED